MRALLIVAYELESKDIRNVRILRWICCFRSRLLTL